MTWRKKKLRLLLCNSQCTEKLFRQINYLVILLVKTSFSRNFCLKTVRVNFCNFHSVSLKLRNFVKWNNALNERWMFFLIRKNSVKSQNEWIFRFRKLVLLHNKAWCILLMYAWCMGWCKVPLVYFTYGHFFYFTEKFLFFITNWLNVKIVPY